MKLLVKIDNQTFNLFFKWISSCCVLASIQQIDVMCVLAYQWPFLVVLWFYNCQKKHDSFASNSPISTVLTVECFLEVILPIYLFKRVNFLFENGIVESKTCKQYGRHKERAEFNPGLMNKSNDDFDVTQEEMRGSPPSWYMHQ